MKGTKLKRALVLHKENQAFVKKSTDAFNNTFMFKVLLK